jgi:hypothetical protein
MNPTQWPCVNTLARGDLKSLAHLALQGPVIRRRHDLFAAAGGGQRPLHHQPAPREELVCGNAMSASHQAYGSKVSSTIRTFSEAVQRRRR